MSVAARKVHRAARAAPLSLAPLNTSSLRNQVYAHLKAAIADMDIYNAQQQLRLDERELITRSAYVPPFARPCRCWSRKGSFALCRAVAFTSFASPSARSSR